MAISIKCFRFHTQQEVFEYCKEFGFEVVKVERNKLSNHEKKFDKFTLSNGKTYYTQSKCYQVIYSGRI